MSEMESDFKGLSGTSIQNTDLQLYVYMFLLPSTPPI